MEQEKKQVPSYTAEQYLMTAFSRADWIRPEYKQLSGLCKENPRALRELYMCACDKVSIEAVRLAISNEPVEENLKKVRSKHFENKYIDIHNFYVNELTETVDALRKEVEVLSSASNKFTETIPSLEELFSSVPVHGGSGQHIQELMNKEEAAKKQSIDSNVENEKLSQEMHSQNRSVTQRREKNMSKCNLFFGGTFMKKFRPAEFLEQLYKEEYNSEQINYIIGCIEEGLDEKEIKTFISPKFEVDTMKRLRRLYIKE